MSKVNLPTEYLQLAEQYGYSLNRIGINSIAFPKEAAIQAVEILAKAGIPVLGGDVFHEKKAKLVHSYDNWYSEKGPGETTEQFAVRAAGETRNYIMKYNEPENIRTLYSLVLSATL